MENLTGDQIWRMSRLIREVSDIRKMNMISVDIIDSENVVIISQNGKLRRSFLWVSDDWAWTDQEWLA